MRQHDEVSVYYDSMLAKLVVWGEDRAVARKRLLDALSRYHLAGLSTNLSVLAKIVHHGDFEAGDFDNTFIDRHHDELLGPATVSESERLALAAVDAMLGRAQASAASARRSGRSRSPWLATDSWRPNGAECDELHFVSGSEEHTVTVEIENDERFAIQIAGSSHVGGGVSLDWQRIDQGRTTVHQFKADISGREFRATSVIHGSELTLFLDAETFRLASRDLAAGWFDDAASAGAVLTPMPGKIIEVMVAVGDLVENGQPMVVLEAMKMEHTVCANGDAVVDELKVEAGDQVDDGATLLVLSEVASATN